MKQKIHYLFMLLLMIIGGAGGAKAEELFYELTPQTNSASASSAYSDSYDFTINGITWSVTGNTSMNPWRIGGKSLTNKNRTVYSKTKMPAAISRVELTVGAASSITVNSLKLIIASDENFDSKIDEVTVDFSANSTITFKPSVGTEWASNAYYKFVFNVTVSGSSNKFVEFTKAEFYSAGADSRTAVNITEFTAASTTLTKGNTTTTTVTNDQTEWTPSYTYTSSKESVATVNDYGVITAVGKGEATITATLNIAADNKSYKAGETNSKSINITVNNPYHTASFSINGETSNEDFEEGAAITFPTNIADINGKSFVGWTVDAIDGTTEMAPSFVNSATMGENDITYYAVFATKAEGNYTTITDVLNRGTTGVTSTSYTSWSNKKATSDAIYAGQSAGGNSSIQLRSDNNSSGVISTTSGGNLKEIVVTWESNTANGRTLNIYGSNSAYTSPTELYNSNKQGTLLGTMKYDGSGAGTTTSLTVADDYKYIGLRSASGAMYLASISITWASGTPDTYSAYCTTVVVDNRQEAGISFGVETVEKELKSSYTGEELTNPNNLQVTYSSSDESVATVNSEGVVTILAEGETVINAAFEGNDEYKPANANYILTVIDSRINANPTFASESVNVMIGETVNAPALTKAGEGVVSYSTSDAAIATVDEASGVVTGVAVGTATITATVAETNSHKGGTASFTVTVKDPNELSATFNFDNDYEELFPKLEGGLSSGDYTKEDYNDSGDFKVAQTATKEGIELTVSPAEEGKAPNRLWDGTPRLRMYSGTLTISAPSACKIKVITFTGHEKNFNITQSVGTLNGKVWKGDAETVVFTINGNTQISTIEVAYETTPVVEPGTPAAITAGFYTIKNLGNGKYVNVAGRKTATLVDNAEGMAGTVIQVESDADGIVKTLRSQGVDVPGYATRAMKYVPDVVKLVVEKLHISGSGEILGETGVDKILDKFNKSVDVNLHVVHADGGYRIYGKTPSMTPVKEFYQENKANVDAKLPGLEKAINDAIATIVDKVGKGESLKNTFKLETIWQRMGWTDYKPGTEEATQVAFLQQVLANEENIWNFAYQTAMFYMEWVEGKQAFQEMQEEAPELMKYWNLAKKVRPNFMYYIVQKDGKVDVISQGNEAILNNDKSTVWALEEVSEFKVNLATFVEKTAYPTTGGEAKPYTEYYGTLYTDFAYRLPEGVTAYKVTGINKVGDKAYVKKAELNSEVVPAQTPVLLIANTDELTLTIAEGGEAVADNQLYGNDYLINEYDINTPQLEGVFNLLAQLSQSTYDKYEYLMRKNAGTVNNKYFFGIAVEGELNKAYKDKTGKEMESSPVLKLGLTDGKVGFFESWNYLAGNEGFMFSEEESEILMNIVGDVNRDGTITISDVTALVNIILGKATYPADADKYDFEAADVNGDKVITISDVTALVNIILGK